MALGAISWKEKWRRKLAKESMKRLDEIVLPRSV